MDRGYDVIRLGRQEAVQVAGRLAFLDLSERRPIRPDPREAGEGTFLVQSEPDISAGRLVELAEGCEGHDAPVLDAEPALPVLAADVSDVRSAAVRLHPKELLEIDLLAL